MRKNFREIEIKFRIVGNNVRKNEGGKRRRDRERVRKNFREREKKK